MNKSPVRETTQDERFTWGDCPICDSEHGKPCNGDIGISLGLSSNGLPPIFGVHIARLRNAPRWVRLEACWSLKP